MQGPCGSRKDSTSENLSAAEAGAETVRSSTAKQRRELSVRHLVDICERTEVPEVRCINCPGGVWLLPKEGRIVGRCFPQGALRLRLRWPLLTVALAASSSPSFLAPQMGLSESSYFSCVLPEIKGADPPCTPGREAASCLVPRAFHLSVSSTPCTAMSSQGLSLSGSTVIPLL